MRPGDNPLHLRWQLRGLPAVITACPPPPTDRRAPCGQPAAKNSAARSRAARPSSCGLGPTSESRGSVRALSSRLGRFAGRGRRAAAVTLRTAPARAAERTATQPGDDDFNADVGRRDRDGAIKWSAALEALNEQIALPRHAL